MAKRKEPTPSANPNKAEKATLANLISSKERFFTVFNITRNGHTMAIPLRALSIKENDDIFNNPAPTPPVRFLPPINDQGFVVPNDSPKNREGYGYRYLTKADMMLPDEFLPKPDREAYEMYEKAVQDHAEKAQNRVIFTVLPDELRAEFKEKYGEATDANIKTFFNDVFLPGEMKELYQVYFQITNAVGSSYIPFSAPDSQQP